MASSTLLVVSLRSPLFPVPMANPSWAHGVKRSGPGGAPLGSNNRCSTFRSQVPETNGQNSRSVCISRESVLIGSDAERKGYDDAMWEGDYEPIVYVYRSSGNQAQYTVYDADRHNECHWSTDDGDRGFDGSYAQAQNRARTALTPKVQHGSEAPA